jgi:hypothetical protein
MKGDKLIAKYILKFVFWFLLFFTFGCLISKEETEQMSTAVPGQLPHYLIHKTTPEPLSGLVKLEGNPAVPAELSAVRDTANSTIDKIEEIMTKLYPLNDMAPLGSMSVSAAVFISARRGLINVKNNPDIAFTILHVGPGEYQIDFTAGMPNIFSAHVQVQGVSDPTGSVVISSVSSVTVFTFQAGIPTDNAFNIIFYK